MITNSKLNPRFPRSSRGRGQNSKLIIILLIASFLVISFVTGVWAAIPYDQGIRPLEYYGGARALGMGKAALANYGYPESLLANPALLAYSEGVSATMGRENSLLFSVAYPIDYYSNWGLSLAQTSFIDYAYNSSNSRSGYSSNVVVLSYGLKTDKFWGFNPGAKSSFGVSLKTLLSENFQVTGAVDRTTGSLATLDLGYFSSPQENLSYGVVAENIIASSPLNWSDGTSSNLIPSLKIGASSKALLKNTLASLDLKYSLDGTLRYYLGLEWKATQQLRLRGGYNGQDVTLGGGYALSEELRLELSAASGTSPSAGGFNFSLVYCPSQWVLEAKLPPTDLVAQKPQPEPKKTVVIEKQVVQKEDVIIEKELPPVVKEAEPSRRLLAGELEVVSPADNYETYDQTIFVTGEAGKGVAIKVNNNDVVISMDGTFGVVVPLGIGKNVVSIDKTYQKDKKSFYLKVLRKAKVLVAEEKQIDTAVGDQLKKEEARLKAEEQAAAKKIEEAQKLEEKNKRLEAEKKRLEEEKRQALEQQRQKEEEAARLAEEQKQLKEEQARLEVEKKQLEAQKKLEEKKKVEEEQARLELEQKRLAEEKKLAEQKKKEEESRRLKAEAERKKVLAEQKRIEEEQVKAAVEAKKAEVEQQRLAEEKKKLLARKEEYEKQKSLIQNRKEKVETLVTLGVIDVGEDQQFDTEKNITRGELATWLVKAASIPLPEVKRDVFSDVPKNHPQAPYIKIITDLGIMQPFSDGTFRPAEWIPESEGQKIFKQLGAVPR